MFGSYQPSGEPGLAAVLVCGVGVIGAAAAAGGGAGTGFTRRWSTVLRLGGVGGDGASWGGVMIWGTDGVSAGVRGVVAIGGAGASCGAGAADAGWGAGPAGAWAGSGLVAGLGWVAVRGVVMMSTPAETLVVGAVAAVVCCWCATRVASTPTMATAIAKKISKDLFERGQNRYI